MHPFEHHDYPDFSAPYYRGEGYLGIDPDGVDRLRLVAYVDGRLVDTWTEPVRGSRWAHLADQFDRERERLAPPPPVPTCERVLRWLDDVCGGRDVVLGLTDAALVEDGLDLPDVEDAKARSRLSAVAELLDAAALRCLDVETSFALRSALLKVWRLEPEVVLEAATAAHAAGGIAWAVAKANALLHPQGALTQGRLRDSLALTTSPSACGKTVQRALVGYRERASDWSDRPPELPDLLLLGHPDLLLGSTRSRLIRVRDRALQAQAAMTAA
jgi:hypothetical protein